MEAEVAVGEVVKNDMEKEVLEFDDGCAKDAAEAGGNRGGDRGGG